MLRDILLCSGLKFVSLTAKSLIGRGVGVVSLIAAVFEELDPISNAAREIGSQSVMVVIDARMLLRGAYEILPRNDL